MDNHLNINQPKVLMFPLVSSPTRPSLELIESDPNVLMRYHGKRRAHYQRLDLLVRFTIGLICLLTGLAIVSGSSILELAFVWFMITLILANILSGIADQIRQHDQQYQSLVAADKTL